MPWSRKMCAGSGWGARVYNLSFRGTAWSFPDGKELVLRVLAVTCVGGECARSSCCLPDVPFRHPSQGTPSLSESSECTPSVRPFSASNHRDLHGTRGAFKARQASSLASQVRLCPLNPSSEHQERHLFLDGEYRGPSDWAPWRQVAKSGAA